MRVSWLYIVIAASHIACAVTTDFDSTQFQCKQTGECPLGQRCSEGVCTSSLGAVDAARLPDAEAAIDAAPIDAGPLARCPSDCDALPGESLCLCLAMRSWDAARDACAVEGFFLARIDNQQDAALVEAAATAIDRLVWLGGSDVGEEGTWLWLDGEIFWQGGIGGGPPAGAFAAFAELEPNDAVNGEDCVGTQAAGWNDADCAVPLPSICARPESAPVGR